MRPLALIVLAACSFEHGAAPGGDGPGNGSDGSSAPTCSDGVKNGTETGVDCGGSCPACGACTTHSLPPSVNVDATQWAASFLTAPSWSCNAAGTTTIDSAAGTITSSSCAVGTSAVTNNVTQLDASGPHVFVVRLRGLTVTNGHVIQLRGDKPIVLLVAGDVLVDTGGMIDAGAAGGTAGPGGSMAGQCVDAATGSGLQGTSTSWGAGGGGFGTAGGQGCYNVVNGGLANGNAMLVPLRGGCSGANSSGTGLGGAGGGAVEISASGTITVGSAGAGNVVASGGGAPSSSLGGNGGGSGGGILLVAPALPAFGSSGAVRANGGAGGSGTSSSGTNLAGQDGHTGDTTQASDSSGTPGGGNGNDHGRVGGMAYKIGAAAVVTVAGSMTTAQTGGRGGGGGGGGRIQLTTGTITTSCD